jgi:predicted TIM-barrel fold metal-dependent hydrolase
MTRIRVLLLVLVAVMLFALAWVGMQRRLSVPVSVATSGVAVQRHTPSQSNEIAYYATDDRNEKIESLGPRNWRIVDIHEHVQTEADVTKLLRARDKLGVQRACLMATSIYTFTLNNKYGFEQYKENNEEILRLRSSYPDRLCAFVTFDPAESGGVELVKEYVSRGADGVKLYLGHGAETGKGPFHVMPLDDPRMERFWRYAEESQLPVLLHVNLTKYWDEFLNVMEAHPYLRVTLPHFGLYKNSEQRLKRLSLLLDRYPYLFTDMSYGWWTFQIEGFETLAKWRERSREFHVRHREKILFASDMVLESTKGDDYIVNTLRSYMQFIEKDRWRFFYVPDRTMRGLGLDDETLAWIYEKAPANFLLLDPEGRLYDRARNGPPQVPRPAIGPLVEGVIPTDGVPDEPPDSENHDH